MVTTETLYHERRIFGVSNMLGDLGGATQMILIFSSFIFFPISEHSFNVAATSSLFMGRTDEDDFFVKEEKDANIPKYLRAENTPGDLSDDTLNTLSKHRHMKISTTDNFLLFISNTLKCCFPSFLWSKKQRMQHAFKSGEDRISR